VPSRLTDTTLTDGLHLEDPMLLAESVESAEQRVQHVHDVLRLALLSQAGVRHNVLQDCTEHLDNALISYMAF
jgi:hypothetical protein